MINWFKKVKGETEIAVIIVLVLVSLMVLSVLPAMNPKNIGINTITLAQALAVVQGNGYYAYASGALNPNQIPYVKSDGSLMTSSNLTFNGTYLGVKGTVNATSLNATQLTATTGNITMLNAPTGRSSTIIVAGSDANATTKAQADYVANATRDDITLNIALRNASGKKVYCIGTFYTYLDSINITTSNSSLDIYSEAILYYSGNGTAIQVNSTTATTNLNHIYLNARVYSSGSAINSTTVQGVSIVNSNLSDFPYFDIENFNNGTGVNFTASTADATQTGWSEENTFQRWSLRDNKYNLVLSGNGSMQRITGDMLWMGMSQNVSGRQYGVYDVNTWGKPPSSISIQEVTITTASPNFTGWKTTGQSHHIDSFIYDDVAANGTTVAINSTQEIYIGNINTVEGVSNAFTNLYIPPESFIGVFQRTYSNGANKQMPIQSIGSASNNGTGASSVSNMYGAVVNTGTTGNSTARRSGQMRGFGTGSNAINYNFNKISIWQVEWTYGSANTSTNATFGLVKTLNNTDLSDVGWMVKIYNTNGLDFLSYNSTLGTNTTSVTVGNFGQHISTIILLPSVGLRFYDGATLVATQVGSTVIPVGAGNTMYFQMAISNGVGTTADNILEIYNLKVWQQP